MWSNVYILHGVEGCLCVVSQEALLAHIHRIWLAHTSPDIVLVQGNHTHIFVCIYKQTLSVLIAYLCDRCVEGRLV